MKGAPVPRFLRDPDHGPLPGLLLLLTLTTGMVDAVTIIRLGKVFTANMTGNTVFIGLAAAGVPGFALWGSLLSLSCFALGVALGGLVARRAANRAHLLRNTTACQVLLLLAATLLSLTSVTHYLLLALCALTFGIQNAAVNVLEVPDLTTSVLTRTLTALIVNAHHAPAPVTLRRLLSVLCIFTGTLR